MNPVRARQLQKAKKAPPPPPPRDQLAPGRWDPAVKKAIDDLAWNVGKGTGTYDEARPPVAVLPWSDAAIYGDAGEAVFARMVEKVDFKYEDKFWKIVPMNYGRQHLRAAYNGFFEEPQSTWRNQVRYQQYCKDFVTSYQGVCERVGRLECREYLTSLFWGFKEDELKTYLDAAVKEEWTRPLGTQSFPDGPGDRQPALIRRGIAPIPEIADLVAFLKRRGFDIWVVADDSEFILRSAVPQYGIDPAHAAGMWVKVASATLTADVLDPVPFRAGKAAVVAARIGRVPALAVGSDPWDLELLGYGEGARLLLDKGDEHLRGIAEEKGWLVQPAFGPPR